MTAQVNTVLNVFRIVGGRRIPYILELDAAMNLVGDRPDMETLRQNSLTKQSPETASMTDGHVTENQILSESHTTSTTPETSEVEIGDTTAALGSLKKTEIKTVLGNYPELSPDMKGEIVSEEKMPGGATKITYNPSAFDIKIGEWVTSLVKNNPFPGTEELRAEYFEAVESLREKHENDGTVCKPCESGALIRKYRAKLESMGVIS